MLLFFRQIAITNDNHGKSKMEMIGKGAEVEHVWLSREARDVIRGTRRRSATRLVYHTQGRLRTDLAGAANALRALCDDERDASANATGRGKASMKYCWYDFYDDADLRERESASITERREMVYETLRYYTQLPDLAEDANEDSRITPPLCDRDEIYDYASVLF
eukprot:gene10194-12061_t